MFYRQSRLTLLALASWAVAPFASALTDKPNFVFVLIDDLGWADISVAGSRYYKTPNIDKFAAEGIRFTNAYAACAVCSPSRAAIMTGVNPARLHITDWIPGEGDNKDGRFKIPEWTQALCNCVPNFPRRLHDAGYISASIGKWHLGEGKGYYPVDIGFTVNVAGGHFGQPLSYFWPYAGKGVRLPDLAESGGAKGEYLTDRLTDEALRFIDTNKDKPFCLYLAHYAVHVPLAAKPEDLKAVESLSPADGQGKPVYAAMIKSVDDSVGRVLERLKKDGLADNTVVIFTSDNGGFLDVTKNPPLRGGKGFPYEGGLRIPLIVRAPGITTPGKVYDQRVIGTDFAPTILALAGAKPLPYPDGTDITAAFKGGAVPARDLGWHYPHYWHGKLVTPYSSLISGDWKIIRWYEYGTEEIYDLAKDPRERRDLAKENPAKLKEMGEKLDRWLKANDAQAPVLKKDAPSAPPPSENQAAAPRWIF